MALPTQVVPCGAQSLGGGYTALNTNWTYRGVVQGRTYRIKLLGTVSSTTANFGVSYNGNSCSLSCDAWYDPAEHSYLAPTAAYSSLIVGRNNGGNLSFTDFEIQDTGSDEGIPTVQVAWGLATGAVSIATPTSGNLLVAQVAIYRNGSGNYADSTVPSGWTAATTQGGFHGPAAGCDTRTFYKVSDGTETSFTATYSTIAYTSPDSVVIREYSGVGSSVAGSYRKANAGVDNLADTPPTAELAVTVLGFSSYATRFDQADSIPWATDLWSVAGSTPKIAGVRDVSPGTYSVDLLGISGGDVWSFETVYFTTAAGGGARSQAIVIA